MISEKLAAKLNKLISNASGGASGVRDEKSLSSVINRPFQTFDGKDLYPSAIDRSAAIFQSIILNHPSSGWKQKNGIRFYANFAF